MPAVVVAGASYLVGEFAAGLAIDAGLVAVGSIGARVISAGIGLVTNTALTPALGYRVRREHSESRTESREAS